MLSFVQRFPIFWRMCSGTRATITAIPTPTFQPIFVKPRNNLYMSACSMFSAFCKVTCAGTRHAFWVLRRVHGSPIIPLLMFLVSYFQLCCLLNATRTGPASHAKLASQRVRAVDVAGRFHALKGVTLGQSSLLALYKAVS